MSVFQCGRSMRGPASGLAAMSLALASLSGASSAFAAQPTPEPMFPPTVHIVGAPAGIELPASNCLVTPSRPGCPDLGVVYYIATDSPGMPSPAPSYNAVAADDPVVDYAELVAAYRSYTPNPVAVYGGAVTDKDYGACNAEAADPANNSDMTTSASSQTCGGQSVIHQEVSANVQRYQRNTGWTNLANDDQETSGPGWLPASAEYDCWHQSVYAYRNKTFVYHTVRRVFGGTSTYSTQITSSAQSYSCPVH